MHASPSLRARIRALALVLGGAAPLFAQTAITWTGASSTGFNTDANWQGGVAPGTLTTPTTSTNTDIAVFDGTARAPDLFLGAHRNLGGVRFSGPAVASYHLSPTGTFRYHFTLGGEVVIEGDVITAQTLPRVGLTGATGDYTFRNEASAAAVTLNFASSLVNYTTGAARLVLAGANPGPNAIVNTISENTGAGRLSVTKEGAGTWVLQGANTFSGGVTLRAGILGLRSNTALGTGPLTLEGGRLAALVVNRTVANAVSITGDVEFGGGAETFIGARTSFTGPVDLTGGVRTLTVGNTASFGGVVANGGITLNATAAEIGLVLANANTYAGGTSAIFGRLLPSHGSALGTGDLVIAGGELRVFDAAIGTVTLGTEADFLFSAGVWTVQLGTEHDRLAGAGGAFAITGGTLVLDVTGAGFDYAQSYPILTGFAAGTVTGLTIVGYDTVNHIATLGADGVLTFAPRPPATPYETWADNSGVSDKAPGADPDGDGLANLLEFVLDGNPAESDASMGPVIEGSGGQIHFDYVRRSDSVAVEQRVETSVDLQTWESYLVPAVVGSSPIASGAGSVVVSTGTEQDKQAVRVSLPAPTGGRIFMRLVAQP